MLRLQMQYKTIQYDTNQYNTIPLSLLGMLTGLFLVLSKTKSDLLGTFINAFLTLNACMCVFVHSLTVKRRIESNNHRHQSVFHVSHAC